MNLDCLETLPAGMAGFSLRKFVSISEADLTLNPKPTKPTKLPQPPQPSSQPLHSNSRAIPLSVSFTFPLS